jgi:hypothetical protein
MTVVFKSAEYADAARIMNVKFLGCHIQLYHVDELKTTVFPEK